MIIAQISDTHIALDTPDAETRIRDFERTIEDINSLEPLPDIIIHSGDIVQNGRADEYAEAARILNKAKVPVYPMVGNKDDREELRKAFPSADYLNGNSDFIAYSIEGFPVRLIVLDTLNPGSNKGEFCEKRIADLDKMLSQDPEKQVVIFAHHPPIVVNEGPDPIHFETEAVLQRFCNALRRSTTVLGLFCGHVHRGVAGLVGAIPVLVMPSIATTLRRGEYPQNLTTCPIYHIHRYRPETGFLSEVRIVRG